MAFLTLRDWFLGSCFFFFFFFLRDGLDRKGCHVRQRSKVSYLPLLIFPLYSLNPTRGTVVATRTRDNPRAMTTCPLSLSLSLSDWVAASVLHSARRG